MNLINKLKSEHIELLNAFDDFLKRTDEPDSKNRLNKLKKILSLHLKNEDNTLYPLMEKSKIAEVSGVAKQFSTSMDKLSKKITTLMNEIEKEGVIDKKLETQLKELGTSLKVRITIEEYTLFPLYEEYITDE